MFLKDTAASIETMTCGVCGTHKISKFEGKHLIVTDKNLKYSAAIDDLSGIQCEQCRFIMLSAKSTERLYGGLIANGSLIFNMIKKLDVLEMRLASVTIKDPTTESEFLPFRLLTTSNSPNIKVSKSCLSISQ